MANKLWDCKYQAFTAAMKKSRIDRNVSQTDLANRLGKPQSFVFKYESGERTLDFVKTLAICDAKVKRSTYARKGRIYKSLNMNFKIPYPMKFISKQT